MHDIYERRLGRALRSVAAALSFLLWTAPPTARAGDAAPADGPAYQVADINTAPDPLASAQARDFVEVGGVTLFSAYDMEHGRELWRTDRTPEGTRLVKDIAPGTAGSDPVILNSAAGVILFGAFEPEADLRLWRSDGTEAGTVEVADLPDDFPYAQEGGFFTIGDEIWAADDLGRGAVKVADLPGGPWGVAGKGARRFVWVGGQLWKTDGTAAGTALLGDFGEIVAAFIGEQGPLWFFSTGWEHGIVLRTTDGTAAGTKVLLDLHARDANACPCWKFDEPILLGDTLLFFLLDYSQDKWLRLWRSDGTTASEIAAFDSDGDVETKMFELDGTVFFPAGNESTGVELWRTDGTREGTRLVADVNPGPATSFAPYERSPDFAAAGGKLYFLADDGTHGRELWRTDGTEEGTSIVRDLNPGPDGAFFWYDDADDFTPRLTAFGDWIVFIGSDGVSGYEFWRTDGTAGGTVRLADAAPGEADVYGCWRDSPGSICTPSSTVLLPFGANDDTILFGAPEPAGFTLWRGDLPTGASARVATFGVDAYVPWRLPSRRDGSILVVYDEVTGGEPWSTDGTSEGTYLLRDFARGNRGSRPRSITAIGNVALFFADDGAHGEELWRSDGTEGGTSLVADIRPGAGGSTAAEPRALGPTIVFAADDGVHGQEIWRSDGTAGGTFLLRDVRDGPETSSPRPIARLDDVLLFGANDGVHGYELWRTDGTVAGTHLVVDIEPGAEDGVADVISTRLGDDILFTGYRASAGGYDVFRTDGTAAGTHPLGLIDLIGRREFAYEYVAAGDFAYFSAYQALWRTDGTPDGTREILGVGSVADLESDGDALFLTAYSREGGKLYEVDAGAEKGDLLGRVDTYGFVAAGGSAFATKTDAQQVVRDAWYELTPAEAGTWFRGLSIVRDRLVFLQSIGSDQALTLWSSDGTAAATRPLQVLPMSPPYLYDGNDFEIVAAGDLAFFPHTGPAGRELWALPLAVLPEVCRDCIPTRTPTPSATPQPTRTPACPRDGAPSCPVLRVSGATGEPGDAVEVRIELTTLGREIPAVQNDLTFEAGATIAATADGKPDCTVNPAIGKSDTAFAFHPRGCTPGEGCNEIRAGVFAFGDVAPIPDGVLYTCRVTIAAGAASGSYPLTLSNTLGFDASWQEVALAAEDGAVTVSDASAEHPIGTRSGAGDGGCQVARSGGGRAWWLAASLLLLSAARGRRAPYRTLARVIASLPIFFSTVPATALDAPADGPAYQVADINTGPDRAASSDARDFVEIGDLVLFTAYDAERGRELWRTDRTPAGTQLVKDLNPGPRGSDLIVVQAGAGAILLAARDATRGLALWRSDGTEAGTVVVADLHGDDVAPVGAGLFRVGTELWAADSSASGAVKLADLPDHPWSLAGEGTRRFVKADGELWSTDGTPEGTFSLGNFGSIGTMTLGGDGPLWFFASGLDGGVGLWTSDGTLAGTQLVKDFPPDEGGGCPCPGYAEPFLFGDTLLFFIHDYRVADRYVQLWRSDGTSAGTIPLRSFNASDVETRMVEHAGSVLFVGPVDEGGPELWRTDGTPEGTFQLADIHPGPLGSFAEYEAEPDIMAVGDWVYFLADDGTHGRELWRTDGTREGTGLVLDLNAQPSSSFFFYDDGDDVLPLFQKVGDWLVFVGSDGISGYEVWRTDGTAGGTVRLADAAPAEADVFGCWDAEWISNCYPFYPRILSLGTDDDTVLFVVSDGGDGFTVWRADLPSATATQIVALGGNASIHGVGTSGPDGAILLMSDGNTGSEPWWTDGTSEGTYLLRDIVPGNSGSNIRSIISVGDFVLFSADDATHGDELWRSDGTEAGTALVIDIRPGPGESTPQWLTAFGSTVFFTADDGLHGQELWRSDGTEAGTRIVKDVLPGTSGSRPIPLAQLGDVLLFEADDGTHGRELWRTDGSEAGTSLVLDLSPDPYGSHLGSPSEAVRVGERVVFTTYRAPSGYEMWSTDGTAEGTRRFPALHGYDPAPWPHHLTAAGGFVYFAAAGSVWKTDGSAEEPVRIASLNEVTQLQSYEGRLFAVVWATRCGRDGSCLVEIDTDSGAVEYVGPADGYPPFVNAGGSVFTTRSRAGRYELLRDGWYELASASRFLGSLTALRDRVLFLEGFGGDHDVVLWSSDGSAAGTRPLQVLPESPPYANDGGGAWFTAAGDLAFFPYAGSAGRELWALPLSSLPEVCRDCVPSPTPTPTLTPIRSATPRPTRTATASPHCRSNGADPTCSRLSVTDASGAPGEVVTFDVELTAMGGPIPAVQNDIAFDPKVSVAARADGRPDCTVNPAIGKGDTAFAFHPRSCTPGEDCTSIRAGVFAFGDTEPIPDGVLYTCRVTIAVDAAPGSYALTISKALGFDATWQEAALTAEDGAVIVSDASAENPIGAGGGAGDGGCQVAKTGAGSAWWLAASLLLLATGRTVRATGHRLRATGLITRIASSLAISLSTVSASALDPPADGPAYQVADINTEPEPLASSAASDFVEVGDVILFTAFDAEHGRELWRTDRTPGGTEIVKDIAPGAVGSNPVIVHATGNAVLLAAFRTEADLALWRSDGTAEGTVPIADLPNGRVTVVGAGFFTIDGELWAADDLATGAVKVTDLPDSPWRRLADGASRFVWLGGRLWTTDGTAAGTVFLGDFGWIENAFIDAAGPLWFFTSRPEGGGLALWTSDGTTAGTKLVMAPQEGGCKCFVPVEAILLRDELLYFVHGDRATERGPFRLWRSDGTPAGTMEIAAFDDWDDRMRMVQFGEAAYFAAGEEASGIELWRSDGTREGTRLVADIHPGTEASYPNFGQSADDLGTGEFLYFTADDGPHGRELWRTDGTPQGTSMVRDLNPGPAGSFFFQDDLEHLLPRFLALGEWLVFVTSNGAAGFALWRTDGTAAGTVRLGDAAPGNANVFECRRNDYGCYPTSPIVLPLGPDGDTLLFGTVAPEAGFDLWRADLATGESTHIASLGTAASAFGTHRRDGAILLVYDPRTGNHPWWTDGTTEGTHLLHDFTGGNRGSRPHSITAVGDAVFFAADDGVHGDELWRSDGTAGGTSLLADIRPGANGSALTRFAAWGGRVAFAADDGVHGFELWWSDGTPAGTQMLRDLSPGATDSGPTPIVELGDVLLFAADDGVHGYELWRTDGTQSGTYLVADVDGGPGHGLADWRVARVGQVVFFLGYGPFGQSELWRTDGTAAGTHRTDALDAVERFALPYALTAHGGFLFFAARDQVWRTDGTTYGTRPFADVESVAHLASEDGSLFATSYCREGCLYEIDGDGGDVRFLGHIDPVDFVTAGGSAFGTLTGNNHNDVIRDGWYQLTPADEAHWFWAVSSLRGRLLFLQSIVEYLGDDGDVVLWTSDGTRAGTRPLQLLPAPPAYSWTETYPELAATDNLVFFPHTGPEGRELWAVPLTALSEVCRDCIPTPTPLPTATPRPTRTPRCPEDGSPACPILRVGSATGNPGDTVVVTVELTTSVREIPAVQNDLALDASIAIVATADGKPDCSVNPAIGKTDTAFGFYLRGCQFRGVPDVDCTDIRAGVFAYGDTKPIPDGVLYTCRVKIADDAASGSYSLTVSKAIAYDAKWWDIPMVAQHGAVIVSDSSLERPIDAGGGAADGSCQVATSGGGSPWWLAVSLLVMLRVREARRRRACGPPIGRPLRRPR